MNRTNPVDTGRKLIVHKTSRTSSERLMYVQFTYCVYGEQSYDKDLINNYCIEQGRFFDR